MHSCKLTKDLKWKLYKKQNNTKTAPYCFFINYKAKKLLHSMSTKTNKQIKRKEKRKRR